MRQGFWDTVCLITPASMSYIFCLSTISFSLRPKFVYPSARISARYPGGRTYKFQPLIVCVRVCFTVFVHFLISLIFLSIHVCVKCACLFAFAHECVCVSVSVLCVWEC